MAEPTSGRGASELDRVWDRLAADRPAGNRRIPVFACHGPGADRQVASFADRLAVPLAEVDGTAPGTSGPLGDVVLLSEIAADLARSTPQHHGALRLPTFELLVDAVRRDPAWSHGGHDDTGGDAPAPLPGSPEQLARRLYSRWAERHWLPRTLADAVDDPEAGVRARLLRPLAVDLPRALYRVLVLRGGAARTITRRVRERSGRRQRDVLDALITLGRWPAGREEGRRRVLVEQLLDDLDRAVRPSLLSTRRRRRSWSFVLAFHGVGPEGPARDVFGTLAGALAARGRASQLLVGAEVDLGGGDGSTADVARTDVNRAASYLPGDPPEVRPDVPPVLVVDVPADAVDDTKRRPVVLPRPVRSAAVVPAAVGVLLAAAVLLAALSVWRVVYDPGCPHVEEAPTGEPIGLGDGTAACSFVTGRGDVADDLRAAEDVIAANNAAAVAYGPDRHVTVVFLAPLTRAAGAERSGQSALRELHAIDVAQREALSLAGDDRSEVAVRVLLANPGERFAFGPEVAGRIVEAADDEGIVGVFGISQTRRESREAVAVLGEADIAVVTGTPTGNEVTAASPHVYQVAPTNDRIAAAMASFAAEAPIVPVGGDERRGPAPADAAVVVGDHTDEYSAELAAALEGAFPGSVVSRLSYPVPADDGRGEGDALPEQLPAPAGTQVVNSLREAAIGVCAAVTAASDAGHEPGHRLVVFYTGRASQLQGLLNNVRRLCGDERVTMVAADAIARFLHDPEVDLGRYDFLQLHYVALASTDQAGLAPGFAAFADGWDAAAARREAAGRTEGASDVAVSDLSEPALDYDALTVLRTAVVRVREAGLPTTAAQVAGRLSDGVEHEGATGALAFGGDERGQVVAEKAVLVLTARESRPAPVLACGEFEAGEPVTTWGDGYPCPPAVDAPPPAP